jgi:hypothetical protein
MRLPDAQRCPASMNADGDRQLRRELEIRIVQTTNGFLPPSSRHTFASTSRR